MTPIILLVSPHISQWHNFTHALAQIFPVEIAAAQTGAEALIVARETEPLAAVVDVTLTDMNSVAFVRRLIEVNAMIHVALVSNLPEEAFHNETEGLGIMLQLPPNPRASRAATLARRLQALTGVLS